MPPTETMEQEVKTLRKRLSLLSQASLRYLAKKEPGQEFAREDEEILAMFASQAVLVIANAHRYRDEQRARADLETLIDTSPVGVAVYDERAGPRRSPSFASSISRPTT